MEHQHRKISLGIGRQEFEPGVHICQIYGDDKEREDALLALILTGIESGEKISCFSENITEERIKDFLRENEIAPDELISSGAFGLSGTEEVYFKDNSFDPARMLDLLKNFYCESGEQGYEGARVIGEMTPKVEKIPGGSRLLEYEARVSMLLREFPVTAVCQYDARSFDGATIMDILKVHPYMVVRGSVIHNPFFIPPEQYLAENVLE